MPHRMVTQLETDCDNLSAAAGKHNPLISEALTEMWRSNLPKGQKMINLFQLQACLADDLINHRDRLVGVDDALASGLTANRAQESARDSGVEALREKLFQARSTFEGVFGAGSSFKIFEEAPVIPSRPRELRRVAQRVVRNLTTPELKLPPTRQEGVTIDPVKLAQGIQRPLDKMVKALKSLAEKRRDVDQSLQQKGGSMSDLRSMVGRTARFLEALYDLAGYDILAARVRPSSHRAARATAAARLSEALAAETAVAVAEAGAEQTAGEAVDGSAAEVAETKA